MVIMKNLVDNYIMLKKIVVVSHHCNINSTPSINAERKSSVDEADTVNLSPSLSLSRNDGVTHLDSCDSNCVRLRKTMHY